ncbi:HD domain-containing protein [Luteolibacter flavescens]|uniref:HD domain-containing protein n=1 Tax=Luteolibacter flavescens TaxID=1859460 RepID=A0ABT3FR31_9BACT|nr:HD domain-containing protein [Luteolibacter flavescens]MCW1886038.1 HD domain-containing protein [Luteolibacter flavescens]
MDASSDITKSDFSLWQRAAAMAASAHEGQNPPGTDMPYFAHVARVAMLVSSEFGCHDPEVLAAAYLHDVFEKTSLTREAVALTMGPDVTAWVEWLSKTSKDEKAAYWERLAQAPWQARLIKMADALDHLDGPVEYREARLKAANRALALATSGEPEIERARTLLEAAIDHGRRST